MTPPSRRVHSSQGGQGPSNGGSKWQGPGLTGVRIGLILAVVAALLIADLAMASES